MVSSLHHYGEDRLVSELVSLLPGHKELIVGPGDDCAVITLDNSWDGLLKTDVVVEDVHFVPREIPERIGHKALARALSDIAAMGGVPGHAVVTLLASADHEVEKIKGIYHGLVKCADQYGVGIAGGETSSLKHQGLIINIALTGKVEKGSALLRSSACRGDLIFVTGTLGGSRNNGKHLDFAPRLDQGRFLHKTGLVHAMMDLSDGLARDMPRMAKASGVSFEWDEKSLPLSAGVTPGQALNDGEDYELLFTAAAGDRVLLSEQWNKAFPEIPLTCIGSILPGSVPLPSSSDDGWDHFL